MTKAAWLEVNYCLFLHRGRQGGILLRYPEELIDRIAKQTDLVGLVKQYVDLKRVGVSWRGLCPFHAEKTPSFYVHPEKGSFYCFGCGEGGGPFKFLMMINGLSFPDAVRELAGRVSIDLPALSHEKVPTLDGRPLKTVLYEVMDKAQEFYRHNLWADGGKHARQYLTDERGLDPQVIKHFGLGLALDSWDSLLRYLGGLKYSDRTMEAAGLVKPRSSGAKGFYDAFRDRLMIPVADPENRVVALAGRTFGKSDNPDSPKYINSPATDIYIKGRILYGLHQARPHVRAGGLIFLVEGYFDLISLVSAGVKPVAAVMGTALTPYQLSSIRSMAKEVHLVFDSDRAGEEATKRALPLLYNAELNGRVIRLPAGHDPDSFIRQFGPNAFFDLADKAADIADYYVSRLVKSPQTTLTGESYLVSQAAEILAQVPDGAKSQYLRNKLAEKLGISKDHLEIKGGPPKHLGPPPTATRLPTGPDFDPMAARLLKHVITHPESAPTLKPDLKEIWPDDRTKPVFEAIVLQLEQTSVLVPERLRFDDDAQMASLISGASASGRLHDAQESVMLAQNLIIKLKSQYSRKVQKELTQAVREAENAGDQELARRLLAGKLG
ncbi:MAG: DNA primase [Deltaproteobacteria bacterium]|nr:DNA primase [Deltaproteobacteria bacterium]